MPLGRRSGSECGAHLARLQPAAGDILPVDSLVVERALQAFDEPKIVGKLASFSSHAGYRFAGRDIPQLSVQFTGTISFHGFFDLPGKLAKERHFLHVLIDFFFFEGVVETGADPGFGFCLAHCPISFFRSFARSRSSASPLPS
jgi:hypothetical protein